MRTTFSVAIPIVLALLLGSAATSRAGDVARDGGWEMQARIDLDLAGFDPDRTAEGRPILEHCRMLGADESATDAGAILRRLGMPAVPYLATGLAHPDDAIANGCARVLGQIAPPTSLHLALLARSDPLHRRAGARLLAASPTADVVPALVVALGDDDPHVRTWGARALGALGPDAASSSAALERAVEDAEAHVGLAALLALARLGPPGRRRAAALLAEPRFRRLAGTLVAVRSGPSVEPGLVDAAVALLDAEGEHARAFGVALLGHASEIPLALEPVLARRLADSQAEVRRGASHQLARIPGAVARGVARYRPLLEDPDPRVATLVAVLLAEHVPAPDLAAPLAAALPAAPPDADGWTALARSMAPHQPWGEPDAGRIAAALGALGAAGRDALLPLVASPEPSTRRKATSALAHFDAASVTPALRSVLADPDPTVRREAAQALLSLGVPDEEAMSIELASMAWQAGVAQDVDEREATADRLAALGTAVLPVLERTLPGADEQQLDDAVVEIVERLGPVAAPLVPALLTVPELGYSVSSSDGRTHLERTIRAIGESARPALERIADDEHADPDVRGRARQALGWLSE